MNDTGTFKQLVYFVSRAPFIIFLFLLPAKPAQARFIFEPPKTLPSALATVVVEPPPQRIVAPAAVVAPALPPKPDLSHRIYKASAAPTVRGFGKQIPLAVAVLQIVPLRLHTVFGAGVDPGVLVDWHGGTLWNHVLDHALAPKGLHVVVRHSVVTILR